MFLLFYVLSHMVTLNLDLILSVKEFVLKKSDMNLLVTLTYIFNSTNEEEMNGIWNRMPYYRGFSSFERSYPISLIKCIVLIYQAFH